jgi:tRNA-Thr(GGU) m(6)t(6)A37 methyltransferase TsaA
VSGVTGGATGGVGVSDFHFKAIGFVRSPFKDKFGIPRQPGLVSSAKGMIKISAAPDLKTALKSLEEFSHLWIVFVFHEHGGRGWKPSIRPPRLGGSKKVGVLASRSPHRPNPIGISAVQIERIEIDAEGGPEIYITGHDLLDGTPVLDIKPYLPYADSIPLANAGWASDAIERVNVTFAASAGGDVLDLSLKEMIIEVLELDPRPAFQKRQLPLSPENAGMKFGIEIQGHEVKYETTRDSFLVTSISKNET